MIDTDKPARITLANNTQALLGLDYAPYRWPETGKTDTGCGFSFQEPWTGRAGKRGHAAELAEFEEKLAVLGDYAGAWVEAKCTVALVPDVTGKIFSAIVNGVVLTQEILESAVLRRRLLLAKLEIKATLCSGTIFNRGPLSDPGKRSFSVELDLKPIRMVW